MSNAEIINKTGAYVASTYGRYPIAIVKGQGARVWDADGKEYLDFVSGLAVCNLGHSHPAVVDAIRTQAEKLIHISNLYHIEAQSELARLLVENSFADKVFFGNSGAEANEAAIKLARRYSFDHYGKDRHEIITMKQSFHGRTMATITATGQEKFSKGFEPLLPGFQHVAYDDLEELKSAFNNRTCAVMLEPIQGEGGVNVPSEGFLKGVRELCDKNNLLLILDEVQVGMGRTGKLFAHEHFGIKPDIMTLAKGIAGGVPMGAMLATDPIMSSFVPGTHASTFGGNPLSSAVGIAVMKAIFEEGILENCIEMGKILEARLQILKKRYAFIKNVRGRGLIYGMELGFDGGEIVKAAMDQGLLLNCAAGRVLRFLPPLNIKEAELDEMIEKLDSILAEAGK